MKKYRGLLYVPFSFAVLFTVLDMLYLGIFSSKFVLRPSLVIYSFLELYIVAGITTLYIYKEYMQKTY